MNSEEPFEESAGALQRAREKLALQTHLFTLEMKQEWQELEEKWNQLQSDLRTRATRREAVGQARQELMDAYERLKSLLTGRKAG